MTLCDPGPVLSILEPDPPPTMTLLEPGPVMLMLAAAATPPIPMDSNASEPATTALNLINIFLIDPPF